MKQTGQLMYEYDLRTDKCRWAGAIEEVTGYSFEEFNWIGKYAWITNIEPVKTNTMSLYPIDKRITEDNYNEELRLRRLESKDVSLSMDLEKDIFFDMDTSVPLGIIINELISNSLKYAFKGRDKGEIKIKLSGASVGNYSHRPVRRRT